MGALTKEILQDWGQGAITSMEPDQAPPTAFIRGFNVRLRSLGGGKAIPARREGLSTLNTTAVTGSSAIVGMHEFRRQDGGIFEHHHLIVSDNGRLDKIDTDTGTLTAIDATAFTASSSQEHPPNFADANNLCFIVNGEEQKKYDGTAVYQMGIDAPSTAPTIADAGDAGNHNGTYEARVAYGNTDIGLISSSGTTSSPVSITNSSINWTNVPVSADPQVDIRYLLLRNTTTQNQFYVAGSIANNVATSASTNLLDSSLTEVAPDQTENDPPPADGHYIIFQHSRLFVANTTDVAFSKLPTPQYPGLIEAFDPDNIETPNPEDGQIITGLAKLGDLVVILKNRSVIAIDGDDPETWDIVTVSTTYGCTSHRSIRLAGGKLYWWSEQGPVVWDGAGAPELIATPFISETISSTALSYEQVPIMHVCAADDTNEERIIFSVPQVAQTRNTLILPFNYRINRWESDGWDPLDAASLAVFDNDAGQAFVVIGGYAGQVFRMGGASNDGVDSGTASGTFTASGTSVTTVTDLTATFDTTGAGLKERKVSIVDDEGNLMGSAVRPRISSNTATSFTLNAAVQGLEDGTTYYYYIGGPALDFQTIWLNQEDAFTKKRYMHLYTHFRLGSTISRMYLNIYTSFALASDINVLHVFSSDIDFQFWDDEDVLWDDALWAGSGGTDDVQDRFRVGRSGTAALIRIRLYEPDTDIDIVKLGLTAEILSERIG